MQWIRDRGLTLLLMAMFLLFLVGQVLSGRIEYNAEQQLHGQPAVSMRGYLATGQVDGYLHAPLNNDEGEEPKRPEEDDVTLAREMGFGAEFVETVPPMNRPGTFTARGSSRNSSAVECS